MTPNAPLSKIAFLGIGLMGKPMATRLLLAGYPLVVWNRTRVKAEALMPLNAEVADQVVDAVSQADIVVTMLARIFHEPARGRGFVPMNR